MRLTSGAKFRAQLYWVGFGVILPLVPTGWMPESFMESSLGPAHFVWASLTGWGLAVSVKGRGFFRKTALALGGASLFLSAFICRAAPSGAASRVLLAAGAGFAATLCVGLWICAWMADGIQK